MKTMLTFFESKFLYFYISFFWRKWPALLCSSWCRLSFLQRTWKHHAIASAFWLIVYARSHFLKIKRNHMPCFQKYSHWKYTDCISMSSASQHTKNNQRHLLARRVAIWANTTLNAVLLRIIKQNFCQMLVCLEKEENKFCKYYWAEKPLWC